MTCEALVAVQQALLRKALPRLRQPRPQEALR